MNVQNRKSVRRRGHVLVRTVLGLMAVTSGVVAYVLSQAGRFEWVISPAIVVGLLGFAAALYSRARNRREWSAAWDAYAARETGRGPTRRPVSDRARSLTASN